MLGATSFCLRLLLKFFKRQGLNIMIVEKWYDLYAKFNLILYATCFNNIPVMAALTTLINTPTGYAAP